MNGHGSGHTVNIELGETSVDEKSPNDDGIHPSVFGKSTLSVPTTKEPGDSEGDLQSEFSTISLNSGIPQGAEGDYDLPMSDEEHKKIELARWVSYVSIFLSLLLGSLAIGYGSKYGGLSIVALGLEFYIDLVSSVLVLWRFKTPKHRHFQDRGQALAKKMQRDAIRERSSSFWIGVLFLLLGLWVVIEAIVKLHENLSWKKRQLMAEAAAGVAWPSAVLFSALVWWKFRLAAALHSQVIRKDAVCSLFGVVLSLVVGIAALVDIYGSRQHKGSHGDMGGDGIAAILLALFILGEGGLTVYRNTCGWWESKEEGAFSHQQMA